MHGANRRVRHQIQDDSPERSSGGHVRGLTRGLEYQGELLLLNVVGEGGLMWFIRTGRTRGVN